MAGKSQFNGDEKFNDGREYQISKVSSFNKVTGSAARKLEPGSNTAYFVTRVSQAGVLPTGEVHYKREVIMFDSKEKLKAYNNLTDDQKGLGANGLGVTVATGSSLDGQKTFELTEKGANIPFIKNNEDKLKKYSSNGVKDIAKGENPAVKDGLRDFSNNKFANSKDDALDSKPSPDKKSKSLDSKLARGNVGKSSYPTMFYPSHIADSVQDKLKITILKPRDVNSSSRNRKKFIAKKSGNTNMGDGSGILIPNDYKNFPKGHEFERFNNMQGKYTGMIQRKDFQRNQDKIYAASDNLNRSEFNKTPIGHIFLPIPDGVTDQNKVNFGEGTLNPVEKLASGLALQFLLGSEGAKNLDTAAVLKKKIKDPNTKKALSNLIAGSATGINTDELLARTQGSILNNNLALLFKGPTLRTFTFQFVLSPRDRGEALQVRQIIRALKQSSAAQRTRGGTFLGAPNTYTLQFLNGLRPHGFLPRIKECALLSVGVNYMPENSYMTYEDSSMVSYSLSLSFQETESLYNDDYDSDNNTPVTEIEDGIFEADFAGQASSRGIGF